MPKRQVVAAMVLGGCTSVVGAFAFAPIISSSSGSSMINQEVRIDASSNTNIPRRFRHTATFVMSSKSDIPAPYDDEDDDEDDDDDEEEEKSIYEEFASSEFDVGEDDGSISSSSSMTPSFLQRDEDKPIDWGGEYGTLRSRAADSAASPTGKIGASRALFRIMTADSPTMAVSKFVEGASPQVVTAMSSAVANLLGGLANPGAGVETIVKANGEKLGSLCFQLQMTGYMFRNAEYVLAIRDLMNIRGPRSSSIEDYKRAFDKLDSDGSGYIESSEVEDLLNDVYGKGETPAFEVDTFLQFFDSNNDGRISWKEFESGLGVAADNAFKKSRRDSKRGSMGALTGTSDIDLEFELDDDDDDEDEMELESTVTGMVQIEMKNGKVIEIEAKEYIEELKKEAEALKAALKRESGISTQRNGMPATSSTGEVSSDKNGSSAGIDVAGISAYIASQKGDIKALTKGISPEVVEAMQMLIEFVLEPGAKDRPKSDGDKKALNEIEMEIPGSALQQLALWQLVLGYKLRENEATGEYRKLLE
eukprot:CAMPEP_0194088092 /NCGR_PEP_ID=MMETSP0149-20130528/27770_1 /TAXON_ID=122233 /ORGANISM="Chaetoceros debilis, Strain MM31A-1" /LENGTH=534 /DNA_ID=CAMNT_0038771671 /DNA_START=42 /DNA_END=1646 /DNA_ORIENTATION=+